jgi:hypothetical protein
MPEQFAAVTAVVKKQVLTLPDKRGGYNYRQDESAIIKEGIT